MTHRYKAICADSGHALDILLKLPQIRVRVCFLVSLPPRRQVFLSSRPEQNLSWLIEIGYYKLREEKFITDYIITKSRKGELFSCLSIYQPYPL